jgi:galactokinase
VNLIGEHTDYNAGFALPLAIELGCTATVELTRDDTVVATSAQQSAPASAALSDLYAVPAWARYVSGVVWALQQHGVPVPGLRISVDSSVPAGAGLSSSAALICSVATAIDDLLGLDLSMDDLLAITRSAENDFVGAPTGGLDQLAALRSEAGHALLCDFAEGIARPVPFDLDAAGLAVLVIDTGAPHSHASGEYAARRADCERAARELGVASLREIDVDELPNALIRLESEPVWRYVRHVVTENDRVLQTFTRLDRGDLASIGPLLTASHASLRDDFQVSTDRLDVVVEAALDAGAYGARMTGGGFGGCAIALLETGLVDHCRDAVAAACAARDFPAPTVLRTSAGPGAHPL